MTTTYRSITRPWIFTFGVGHTDVLGRPLAGKFVRIIGTREEARREMVRRCGTAWAFQYETEEQAGVATYGLTELQA